MKNLLVKIFLITAACLFSIVLIEALLQTYSPVLIHTITSDSFRLSTNPKMVYELKPLSYDHNRDGLRDHDYLRNKPRGTYRIAIIGDSLAYGVCVLPLDNIYAKVLEKKLNQVISNNIKYEVINFGVPGYKTVQIVERFKEKVLQYNPDLVIYGYWLDDITDNFGEDSIPFFQTKNDGNKILFLPENSSNYKIKKIILNSQIIRRILLLYRKINMNMNKEVLLQNKEDLSKYLDPYMLKLYNEYLIKYSSGKYDDLGVGDGYYGLYVNNKDFILWNNALLELTNICRRKNIKILFLMTSVLYDSKDNTYNWKYLHEFIQKIAGHYSIPVLDLQKDFSKYQSREISIGDCEHPNIFGNSIIAEKLFQYLSENKIP